MIFEEIQFKMVLRLGYLWLKHQKGENMKRFSVIFKNNYEKELEVAIDAKTKKGAIKAALNHLALKAVVNPVSSTYQTAKISYITRDAQGNIVPNVD